jgi:hypothetical protein
MKADWVNNCVQLCYQPAEFYSGSRKIIQDISLEFSWPCDLTYADAGYNDRAKSQQLDRNYLDQESIDAASQLWDSYRQRPKYRSVMFSTVRTLIKDHKGPRGSKMGACILGVILTMNNKGTEVEITFCYRTSELLKKFPADLVYFSNLITKNFNLDGMKVTKLRCYFTNITVHPAYFVILIPHLKNPVKVLEQIRAKDEYFWQWCVKWSGRYLIKRLGHGIAKFSQALQVKRYATNRITGDKLIELQNYIEENHPGYKHTRFDDAGEQDEVD